ncbi:DNA-binding transcriptional regulator [Vibrio zhanjiangensis]|uniref:DNA-binding transcriptional regulator n=1 Tax=Vibrio zhanjiangensis TaxID=1046128 RepID=A0ABQ6F5S2_9VIBR|nr:YafY family protein [Vibrio zhanjiangensis]GLT20052.1 DNA-binding transcriptional regulator [Vibrio zhanjiangensis]
MNKPERLLELITLLRSKRYAITAGDLAQTLNVSERTVYRDIQSLINTGVPIHSEAGVGYVLSAGSHLPPLMFTEQEMLALELGMQMVKSLSDNQLSQAAVTASTKILSVLPDKLKQQIENFPIRVPNVHNDANISSLSETLRYAIKAQFKTQFCYLDRNLLKSKRIVQPLGLVFWGHAWTLVAWCEIREDYRQFRLDRISGLDVLKTSFQIEEDKSLEHYVSINAPKH